MLLATITVKKTNSKKNNLFLFWYLRIFLTICVYKSQCNVYFKNIHMGMRFSKYQIIFFIYEKNI